MRTSNALPSWSIGVLITALFLGGCASGGGSGTNSSAPPPPVPTVIISINPSTILESQSATLTWSSTNASSCMASGAWSGSTQTSGSQTISQSSPGTYTYTLTCNGSGGSANNSATLTVPNPPTVAIGVTVLGLWGTGGGLVLTDNNNDPLPVAANGIFTFPTRIQTGGNYSVTVLTQPVSPAQVCLVTGGSGTVMNGPANISVDCGHAEWAWMGGSTSYNQPGIYGTLGVPASNNIPGTRMSAARWADKQGNFWLFGGVGLDSNGNEGQLNDLWKFSNNQWTWISGSDLVDQAGTYGANGTVAASNFPGARGDALTWVDPEGNFWVFGGFGFDSTGTRGYLNDLWKYSSGEWTWISGSQYVNQSGSYGTLGTPSPSNVPGGRYYSSAWLGNDGSFWLYGGAGFDSTGQVGYLSDLWKYSGGEWTWIAGPTLWGQDSVYGTQGVPAAGNTPGDRHGEATWTDSTGNLWLFGGLNPNTGAFLDDVWQYSNGLWTWETGSSGEQQGVYGTQGVPAAGNIPGGRFSPAAWQDISGNVWIFGGFGLDSTGETLNYLSDLWRYSGGEWTWMGGPMLAAQPAVFGTQGLPAPNNVPGPRYESVGWVDSNQNFWLFSGYYSPDYLHTYYYNDVWKLLP